MFRVLMTLSVVFWSSAAFALSCLPHDVASVYHDVADSRDRYMVVVGEMTFDRRLLPKTDLSNQSETPPDTYVPTRLKGLALSRAGFTYPYDQQITLNVQCFGPWCASAISGKQYLAFVNLDKATPEVVITPCGGFAFAGPTKDMQKQVVDCRNGGRCDPKRHR